ncbi:23S rRNA methyltransferase [Firmicutes bacterium CAG:884]|nr:23S rRNA (guanosine(2251)-2'-O)-methyltransferase RlmB [Bacillota bacterium]CCY93278.1 23S rRNA methyltransferase [Firmicutes bacterium CAG:884]
MLIYGKNVTNEYLKTGKKINKTYLLDNYEENSNFPNIERVNKMQMDKLVKANTQGIVLDIDYEYSKLEEITNKENPLIVILDHLEDPHNLGAIIRTCEAAGVDGIIIPENRSVSVNSTVVHTSAGSIFNMKIVKVVNLRQTITKLKKEGFWFIGTDMEGTDYKKIDYKGKTCIIIGSEGFGMSRIISEECDYKASIKMNGKVNSLNASVAAGIIIYEAIYQRNNEI